MHACVCVRWRACACVRVHSRHTSEEEEERAGRALLSLRLPGACVRAGCMYVVQEGGERERDKRLGLL